MNWSGVPFMGQGIKQAMAQFCGSRPRARPTLPDALRRLHPSSAGLPGRSNRALSRPATCPKARACLAQRVDQASTHPKTTLNSSTKRPLPVSVSVTVCLAPSSTVT